MRIYAIAALLLILSVTGYGQAGLAGCLAVHRGDSLVLENTVMQRVYLYNGGNLIASSVTDKRTGKKWIMESRRPAFSIPGVDAEAARARLNVREVSATRQAGVHLEAELIVSFDSLQVKRVFKIYPDCPAIACDLYLKGAAPSWLERSLQTIDPKYPDTANIWMERRANSVVIDRLSLPGRQWKVTSIEFFDITDKNNTLVQEYPRLAYLRENWLRGNLLFMQESFTGDGLFWLKEAPVSGVQLSYPGFDFSVKLGDFQAAGIGIGPKDLSDSEWIRGYSIVAGVASGGDAGAAVALRTYQQHLRNMAGEDMIMLNTWGDRGQDKNINESFVLNELRLGSRLGITHLQMDDGWQTGKSASSAFQGGSFKHIWQNPDYWQPDPVKLPHGFDSIVAEGNRRGILISTWFNPYPDSSFKYWQKDADVLIGQYKKYGIHTWKIDGVNIPDKRAEINFRKMLDTVIAHTQQETVFNL
ncbi:MAG TPA: hypothetical protein VLD19_16255, partial [Chitinophagaceae bacterium]|nr:hypothetical protein [Chitinophagaceae bacterium]